MEQERLKYPIGRYNPPAEITPDHVNEWIDTIESFPNQLSQLVEPLSDQQLDTPYRPEGWTIRQVVHHVGDSHANAYIRFKWTMTEDSPLIKAYFEDRWAEIFDTKLGPVAPALDFLKALHVKWVLLLRGLDDAHLQRTFQHPETNESYSLKYTIGNYAWHSNHHYAHVQQALGMM